MRPYFSIVIPLYNKANKIIKTLESTLGQTFRDFEIIIINDGSTDEGLAKVKKIKDKRIKIFTTENKGVSHARNFGIEKASADFIAFLDADDIWYKHHLADLKDLIESYPNCGMYCKAYEKDYNAQQIVKAKFNGLAPNFEGIIPDYFNNSLVDAIAWTSAVAIPKQIFKTHGYFDMDLRSAQDTDLWVRIALDEPVAFSSKISAVHIYENQKTHLSKTNSGTDNLKLFDKFALQEKENSSLKKYLDYNRFAMAIERKIQGNHSLYLDLLRNINTKNLNWKQNLALKIPPLLLRPLLKIQKQLLKKGVYLSVFR